MKDLINEIIEVASKANLKYNPDNFRHDTEESMRALSKLTGVPIGYNVRLLKDYGSGIVQSIEAPETKFENCQEVYIAMLFPQIMRNEFGNVILGKYKLGYFVEALIEARKIAKRRDIENNTTDNNTSLNIKILINMLFSFVTRSNLERAEEVARGVPKHSRHLIFELFDKLNRIDDVYPIRVHVDSIIVSSLIVMPDLSDVELIGYKVIAEPVDPWLQGKKDVVIVDRIRYIVGKAHTFVTMNKREAKNGTLTRKVNELKQRVWENV